MVLFLVLTIACSTERESAVKVAPEHKDNELTTAIADKEVEPITNFKTIEWIDLMPAHHLDAILNPPDYFAEIEDGTVEDRIDSSIQTTIKKDESTGVQELSKYQQALVSTEVIGAMDGQKIRLPGYVVPLELDENRDVLSFFLVPFFGACIHAPPPPPNQIIYVESDEGFLLESLYDPVWISGTISTQLKENDLATAAYTMKLSHFENF